jgi:two-component system cell cycle sensor histidine kinase/response regulator CckA
VLVSSGYSKEEQLKEMMEKGCDDFILKPFDVVMLSEKLQSVFNLMEKV